MIQARGLTKRYGPALAVDGLTFDVLPGRVTGFLGPNGAGKTTTMRLIIGLDTPTAGHVTVNGRAYTQHRFPAHEVGALIDAMALHPGRRAVDHLWSLAESNDIGRHRVDAVLELVGLSDVAAPSGSVPCRAHGRESRTTVSRNRRGELGDRLDPHNLASLLNSGPG